MIYPQDFEKKVGFDKIKDLLQAYCMSEMGIDLVQKIKSGTQLSKISTYLSQAEEMLRILEKQMAFPQADYFNMIPTLNSILPKGTFITQEELPEFKSSLETINEIKSFFERDEEEEFPSLGKLTHGIPTEISEILQQLNNLLNEQGEIKDTASTQLSSIRKKLLDKERSISSELRKIFTDSKKSGIIDSGAEMTIRGGRLVLPVPASNKRKINGYIHDQSATGQTVFIEPSEIFEGNNEMLQLKNDEKREVISILKGFSEEIRYLIPDLIRSYKTLGVFDFIRAKARLAQTTDSIKPNVSSNAGFSWLNSRHPILQLNLKKEKKEIIPLSINISSEQHILIISGPNAGGKSVALKTVALIQYMFQCGLLVPVDENSDFCLFDQIFIDIGDQQSIEKDLSTYSSHLLNMNFFLENCNSDSLILIDEFGTGTDPQLGGAIAQAILEELIKRKTFGIITTHYSNIKNMGGLTKGIQNAAMLFDQESLSPLFQLIPGQPGHSYAFSIARNSGIKESIIQNAETIAGKTQVDYEDQLNRLKTKLLKLEKDQQRIDFTDDVLAQTLEDYKKKKADLEKSEKEILNAARSQAALIIAQANKKIEKTIKDIIEAKADKEKTQLLRTELAKEQKSISSNLNTPKPKKASSQELKAGDIVRIIDGGSKAEVVEIKSNSILVQTANIKIELSKDRIEKIHDKDKKPKDVKLRSGNIYNQLNKKLENFHPVIDLRGKRTQEALNQIDKFLDDAVLLSFNELRIIHGKGDGILRVNIQAHLKKHPNFVSLKDESPQFGGQGITIVTLK